MNIAQLQAAIEVKVDGVFGPVSRASLVRHFTNRSAGKILDADLERAARRLNCTVPQIRAVRVVEAGGNGFDPHGRPKILFERHRFHKLTVGKFSPSSFSNKDSGGYEEPSWDKLLNAIATGYVDEAFQSASWGAFQVMGEWWDELGYSSPYAMAYSAVSSEVSHLEMLLRYIEYFKLQDEIQALSKDPATCRLFAAAYNGPGYKKNAYDVKLAKALK